MCPLALLAEELKRNCGSWFLCKKSHKMALERRQDKSTCRITAEDYIRDDLSPEQISIRLKYKKQLQISHECIYQYILNDKEQSGSLYKHLRCKKKKQEMLWQETLLQQH